MEPLEKSLGGEGDSQKLISGEGGAQTLAWDDADAYMPPVIQRSCFCCSNQ
jgi:hypothetical protein